MPKQGIRKQLNESKKEGERGDWSIKVYWTETRVTKNEDELTQVTNLKDTLKS